MQPAFYSELKTGTESFGVFSRTGEDLDGGWHAHPHYQLTLILAGQGMRAVGDCRQPYAAGEWVLLAPHLPHAWSGSAADARGVVMHWEADLLENALLRQPEMAALDGLLQRARRGVAGTQTDHLTSQLTELLDSPPGFERLLGGLRVLHELARSGSQHLLASEGFTGTAAPVASQRLHLVHEYVQQHFRGPVSLRAAADRVCMTTSAFCRYFKAHSNQTFSAFVTEVRLGHACRLLIESSLSVAQVCYACGFTTVSHFNRQFRAATSITPLLYRRTYQRGF